MVFSHSIGGVQQKVRRLNESTPQFEVLLKPGLNQFYAEGPVRHQIKTVLSISPRPQRDTLAFIPLMSYGLLGGLFLYNVFLFFSLKLGVYGIYVGFVGTTFATLFMMNGFLYPTTGLHLPAGVLPATANVTIALAVLFLIRFSISRKSSRQVF